MLIPYLMHLLRRLRSPTEIMDYVSTLDHDELERFIAQRDAAPDDQRERFVRAFVADTFHFARRRQILPIVAASEAVTQALLSLQDPDGFLSALEDAARRFGQQWFIDNGATAADKWMKRPTYWVWYWLRMGGALTPP